MYITYSQNYILKQKFLKLERVTHIYELSYQKKKNVIEDEKVQGYLLD